jgi:hypothetical protein
MISMGFMAFYAPRGAETRAGLSRHLLAPPLGRPGRTTKSRDCQNAMPNSLSFSICSLLQRRRYREVNRLAEAVWREAIARWPGETIILRQGARVVANSRRPRMVKCMRGRSPGAASSSLRRRFQYKFTRPDL